MRKVLSTKLLDEKMVDTARSMSMALDCIDFICIDPVHFDSVALTSESYDAMAFTSSNAVRMLMEFNPELSAASLTERMNESVVFALSGKTNEELKKYGIASQAVADHSAMLADDIIARGNVRSVLHVCGDLHLDILENKLKAAGISYTPLIVYETRPVGKELTEHYDAIMFFSPSGIDGFLIKNKLDHETLYCCIGETTAAELKSSDKDLKIVLPSQPSPEAMLMAIKNSKL